MAPLPTVQGSDQPVLVRQILSKRYLVNKNDLQVFLETKFPGRRDFEISTKNGRWIFMVPKKLSAADIRCLIAEIQARTDRERADRATSLIGLAGVATVARVGDDSHYEADLARLERRGWVDEKLQ